MISRPRLSSKPSRYSYLAAPVAVIMSRGNSAAYDDNKALAERYDPDTKVESSAIDRTWQPFQGIKFSSPLDVRPSILSHGLLLKNQSEPCSNKGSSSDTKKRWSSTASARRAPVLPFKHRVGSAADPKLKSKDEPLFSEASTDVAYDLANLEKAPLVLAPRKSRAPQHDGIVERDQSFLIEFDRATKQQSQSIPPKDEAPRLIVTSEKNKANPNDLGYVATRQTSPGAIDSSKEKHVQEQGDFFQATKEAVMAVARKEMKSRCKADTKEVVARNCKIQDKTHLQAEKKQNSTRPISVKSIEISQRKGIESSHTAKAAEAVPPTSHVQVHLCQIKSGGIINETPKSVAPPDMMDAYVTGLDSTSSKATAHPRSKSVQDCQTRAVEDRVSSPQIQDSESSIEEAHGLSWGKKPFARIPVQSCQQEGEIIDETRVMVPSHQKTSSRVKRNIDIQKRLIKRVASGYMKISRDLVAVLENFSGSRSAEFALLDTFNELPNMKRTIDRGSHELREILRIRLDLEGISRLNGPRRDAKHIVVKSRIAGHRFDMIFEEFFRSGRELLRSYCHVQDFRSYCQLKDFRRNDKAVADEKRLGIAYKKYDIQQGVISDAVKVLRIECLESLSSFGVSMKAVMKGMHVIMGTMAQFSAQRIRNEIFSPVAGKPTLLEKTFKQSIGLLHKSIQLLRRNINDIRYMSAMPPNDEGVAQATSQSSNNEDPRMHRLEEYSQTDESPSTENLGFQHPDVLHPSPDLAPSKSTDRRLGGLHISKLITDHGWGEWKKSTQSPKHLEGITLISRTTETHQSSRLISRRDFHTLTAPSAADLPDELVGRDDQSTSAPLGYHIPEARLRDIMLTSPRTGAAYWQYSLYEGPNGEPVKVHYCTSKDTTERIATMFLEKSVIGFDIEWKPQAMATDGIRKNVSLIQLASEERIALFHVARYARGDGLEDLVAPSLRKVMESPNISKVGVSVKADCTRLRRFMGIDSRGLFELSHLYRLVKYSSENIKMINKKLVSLAQQVEEHLQLPLWKGDVRSSDWSERLNIDQIKYAASDSYAGFQLFNVMEAKRKALSPSPPCPAHAELNQPIRLADGQSVTTYDEPAEVEEKPAPAITATHPMATMEEMAREFLSIALEDTPKPKSTPASPPKNPAPSPDLITAETWVSQWRSSLPPTYKPKAFPAHLRAYALWHHQQHDVPDAAVLLRDPPLQNSTVAMYVLEAVRHEKLPFEKKRLRAVFEWVVEGGRGRYAGLRREVE